jgi:hypothetical protein
MDIIEELTSHPGLYIGAQRDPRGEHGSGVARIVVTVLPGKAGVTMDYEVLDANGERGHHELAVLARSGNGPVLVTAHTHADVACVLPESEPGYFTDYPSRLPFPMAIRLEVPEPGRLIYSWSYGWQDVPMELRDIGDVRLVE